MLTGQVPDISVNEDSKHGGLITLSVASLVILLDRLTKFIITSWMSEGDSIGVIQNVFHITLVYNKGAAFGLFKGANIVFIFLASFVTIFILFCVWKKMVTVMALSLPLGLILGGAVGNLIDRVMAGYVIDYLDFRIWPVFNIADTAISAGTLVLIWYIFKQSFRQGS